MQIDFHHAVTYLVARIAGFSHDDALKVHRFAVLHEILPRYGICAA